MTREEAIKQIYIQTGTTDGTESLINEIYDYFEHEIEHKNLHVENMIRMYNNYVDNSLLLQKKIDYWKLSFKKQCEAQND